MGFLVDYPIPLPPLPEQERIIAKIEELFTQLDAAVAGLWRVKAALKRYKASVLKAACEGRLVPQDPNDEPAEEMFKRILAEREEKFVPSNGELAELPKGWCWATLEQTVNKEKNSIKRGPFGSSVKKAYFVPKGYKVYEQQNVIAQDFRLGHYYLDENRFRQLQDFQIAPGDLLITGAGTIGKVAVVPENIEPGIINQALIKVRLDPRIVVIQFFIHYFSVKLREFILAQTRGSAMQNISSVRDLKVMPIPIPSLSEQHRIVVEIERRLSVVQELEQTIDANLKRAGRLRQAILKRAFEGRLV